MYSPSKFTRLILVICITSSFFVAEIAVGFRTHSLALLADAFHYLNDLVGFLIALTALKINDRSDAPKSLSYGWQRANLLGAFFNGTFLLALGLSILLQSVERFISEKSVEEPELVMIMGCVGLGLNVISILCLHTFDHDHLSSSTHQCQDTTFRTKMSITHKDHKHELNHNNDTPRHEHDLGIRAVLLHICGDAVNNLGVIMAGAVMWQTKSRARFYADPAVSTFIALAIMMSTLPLIRAAGAILIQSMPANIDIQDLQEDLEKIPGVISVHELHVWRLNQAKTVASVHINCDGNSLGYFEQVKQTVNECFHANGIHSTTVQPELSHTAWATGDLVAETRRDEGTTPGMLLDCTCRVNCGSRDCEMLRCCNRPES